MKVLSYLYYTTNTGWGGPPKGYCTKASQEMATAGLESFFLGYVLAIRNILRLYRENGKENGSYYLGFRVQDFPKY